MPTQSSRTLIHSLADTTLPMLAAHIQDTQPPLHTKPSPSVSKAERPLHLENPFACPVAQKEDAREWRNTNDLCIEGDRAKANYKGMARKTKGTKAPHIPVSAGRLGICPPSLLLWVRGAGDACLAGCLHRPRRRHKGPQTTPSSAPTKASNPCDAHHITSPPLRRIRGRAFLVPRALPPPWRPLPFDLLPPYKAASVPCPFPSRHSSYLGMRANSKRGHLRRQTARTAPTPLPRNEDIHLLYLTFLKSDLGEASWWELAYAQAPKHATLPPIQPLGCLLSRAQVPVDPRRLERAARRVLLLLLPSFSSLAFVLGGLTQIVAAVLLACLSCAEHVWPIPLFVVVRASKQDDVEATLSLSLCRT